MKKINYNNSFQKNTSLIKYHSPAINKITT